MTLSETLIAAAIGAGLTLGIQELQRWWKQSKDDTRNVNLALAELLTLRINLYTMKRTTKMVGSITSMEHIEGIFAGARHGMNPARIQEKYERAIDLLAPTHPTMAAFLKNRDRALTVFADSMPIPIGVQATESELRDANLFFFLLLKHLIPEALQALDEGVLAVARLSGRRTLRKVKQMLEAYDLPSTHETTEAAVTELLERATAEFYEIKRRTAGATSPAPGERGTHDAVDSVARMLPEVS